MIFIKLFVLRGLQFKHISVLVSFLLRMSAVVSCYTAILSTEVTLTYPVSCPACPAYLLARDKIKQETSRSNRTARTKINRTARTKINRTARTKCNRTASKRSNKTARNKIYKTARNSFKSNRTERNKYKRE